MDGDCRPSWLANVGFGFLTLNSSLAIYRSTEDPIATSFVVSSYASLLILFRAIRLIERSMPQRHAGEAQSLKVAVWGLFTVLTIMFSLKVAAGMPLLGAIIIGITCAVTIVAGFVDFFLHQEKETPRGVPL